MDRRNVIAGGAAVVAAAAISGIATERTSCDWECSQISRDQFDNIKDWPEDKQRAAQFSVDRLLKQNPGARVVVDSSECIPPGHPRHPGECEYSKRAGYPDGGFYLVRFIRLDRAIPVAA